MEAILEHDLKDCGLCYIYRSRKENALIAELWLLKSYFIRLSILIQTGFEEGSGLGRAGVLDSPRFTFGESGFPPQSNNMHLEVRG